MTDVPLAHSNSSLLTQTLTEFLGIPGKLEGFYQRQGKMCQKINTKADLGSQHLEQYLTDVGVQTGPDSLTRL